MTESVTVPEEAVIAHPKLHIPSESAPSAPRPSSHTAWSAKCLQTFVGSSWGFLTNVERAIVMPSLWLYLQTSWNLEAAKRFYAATLASFCLAILLFTPLLGYAAHKGVRTPVLLLFSNQLGILGNIMYLIGQSPWILLTGRFISGIGACCDSPLYADMVKLTSAKERTAYIIAMLLPRQVGLLFGPAFTLLVHKLHISVGQFHINVYNVPGLLMAALWGIHCVLVIVAYPNVERIVGGGDSTPGLGSMSWTKRVSRYFFIPVRKSESVSDCKPILNELQPVSSGADDVKPATGCSPCCCRPPGSNRSSRKSIRPYFTFPLITLYLLTFMTNFSMLCLESVLPPVVNRLYGWTEVEMSVVYLSAGGLVLVTYLMIRCLTVCLNDRTILTIGMVSLMSSYLWYACLLAYQPTPGKVVGITLVLCALGLHVLGIPMVATSSEALYSKLAPKQDMDCAQTIFRTVQNVGFFLGLFVGGSITEVPYAGFLLMFLLAFVPFVLLCLVYEAFIPSADDEEIAENDVI